MIAKRYVVEVCEGIMAHIHGEGRNIAEVCVPELGLVINLEACFITDDWEYRIEGCSDLEQVEVSEDTAAILTGLANSLKEIEAIEAATIKLKERARKAILKG